MQQTNRHIRQAIGGFNNYKCINEDNPCDGPYPSQMSDDCSLGQHRMDDFNRV